VGTEWLEQLKDFAVGSLDPCVAAQHIERFDERVTFPLQPLQEIAKQLHPATRPSINVLETYGKWMEHA